jgi:hypothetical protein
MLRKLRKPLRSVRPYDYGQSVKREAEEDWGR